MLYYLVLICTTYGHSILGPKYATTYNSVSKVNNYSISSYYQSQSQTNFSFRDSPVNLCTNEFKLELDETTGEIYSLELHILYAYILYAYAYIL